MTLRRILVLGGAEGSMGDALEGAATQTHSRLTQLSRTDDAMRELDQGPWRAVLVDITTAGASRFCHEVRARRALFNVPLLGITPQLTDLAFSNAFRWGADDVVQQGLAGPIVERLNSLPENAPPIDAGRGEAVIADGDRGRCDVLGRVLANAGYVVRYATDVVAVQYYLTKGNVQLFVVNDELAEPAPLLESAKQKRHSTQWVVTAKQRRLGAVKDSLRHYERVAVMSSHGPPENVLFALNFLNPRGAPQRSQVRALYGAMVLFRPEGEEGDDCGYTYSVSANGIYVRTLLRPPPGNLWLELEPPNTARRVRLLGRVAWTRAFGQQGEETAPPGFGVHLHSGLGDELDLWVRGFNSLEGTDPDSHAVPEVKFTPQPFRVPLPGTLRPTPKSVQATRTTRNSSPIISITNPAKTERSSAPLEPRTASGAPLPPSWFEPEGPSTDPIPLKKPSGSAALSPTLSHREESFAREEHTPRAALPPSNPGPPVTAEHHAPVPAPIVALEAQDLTDPGVPADRPTPPGTLMEVPEPPLVAAAPSPAVSRPVTEAESQSSQGTKARARRGALVALILCVMLAFGFLLFEQPLRSLVTGRSAPEVSVERDGSSTASSEPGAGSLATHLLDQGADTTPPPADATAETLGGSEGQRGRATDTSGDSSPADAPPGIDELLEDETWLRVRSPVEAQVFVHGISVGPTNQWVRSKCGMRFIRLGKEPGRWLSDGSSHKLACREPNELAIPESTSTDE